RRRPDLKPAIPRQEIHQHLDDRLVVVHHDDPALARVEVLDRDVVFLHELDEGLARDAAMVRARHAEAVQLAAVETTNDRLLADVAALRRFAGRVDVLHYLARMRGTVQQAIDGRPVFLYLLLAHSTGFKGFNNSRLISNRARAYLTPIMRRSTRRSRAYRTFS